MLGAQADAQSYHHTRFGDMPTPGFANAPPVEPESVPFIRPRTRTEWYLLIFMTLLTYHPFNNVPFNRSKEEFLWLLRWGQQWVQHNPGVQYSWVMCLRAIKDDATASSLFSDVHQDKLALSEAHKRALRNPGLLNELV